MGDIRDNPATDGSAERGTQPPAAHPARRGVLMLGAVAASSVVTIRPALAQTATSVLNCKIPLPDPPNYAKWIGPRGELVPANTPGAVPPPPTHAVTGDQARAMIGGSTPPGIDPRAREAYVQYIRRLRQGQSGFTCFNSVQTLRT